MEKLKKTIHRLEMKLFRLKKAPQTLQDGYDEARGRLRAYGESKEIQQFLTVLTAAEQGEKAALFIQKQVVNFHAKNPAYSEAILRDCVLWKACSNKGYSHVRSRALFKLPCRTTLQKYVGKSAGEVGITPLIKERLRLEREGLVVEQERMGSLIIDEVSIHRKVIYDRQVDNIFGLVDMRPGSQQGAMAAPRVANRFRCFTLRGLSTPYVIPVGYFFTRCLKGEKLSNITAEAMKLTEEAGFRIVRVVTDNHQTNLSLFKSLSDDGTLSHVATHPVRVGDPLFLSFDQNHLIKNLRNNFLERELLDGDQLIKGGVYMEKLFEIQSQLLVKPEEPFYATDDERLLWLEVDFINYIEDLQLSGSRSKQKITKETYEATLLTTRSTVAVIEYLLDHVKFRYVLTWGFNSDPVESFFSCLRQFNGGNDRVDARAAVFSVEKLLKVGILHAAKTGNAPSSSESNAVVSLPSQHNDVPSCPVEIKRAARELSGELQCVNYLVTCAR
ncbi:hypothetical protein HPB49_011985 [Dermacentor silvarum]|uniref:Uncharacterized protein n=1 Tax=Dermacentor silvarum TaxID=543639 RepID=A0ACB8CXA4_DERSI|nr:hypothetical protein HPB49_011985 [Dermacentor silvarum]